MIHKVPETSDLVGVLVGIEGKLKGRMFRVGDGESKLGRSELCEVHLLDPQISREHAQIVHQEGVLVLRALSPENPIQLNGEPVDDADQLSDGDKLKLGGSSFRFRTIEGP